MVQEGVQMRLAVIGCGVIGGTLYKWLKEHTEHEVMREDPGLGFDEIKEDKKLDAIFVCVPVPSIEGSTSESWVQDTRILKDVIKKYRHLNKVPFYIRSTVLPKTCDSLVKFFKMKIYAMPEFLTARNAYETMCSQNIIVGSEDHPSCVNEQVERVEKIFPGKTVKIMSNREAELAKFAHNCLGAIKVNFFNIVAKYAETIHADYNSVLDGVLMSGYVNKDHTNVPGPDGKYGFAGTCFPPNMLAFYGEAKRLGMHVGSIKETMIENGIHRGLWKDYYFIDPKDLKIQIQE